MIKVYCLELDTTKKSDFSISMSMKYKEHKSNSLSNYAWYALEKILNDEFDIKINKDMIYYNERNKPYIYNNDIYFNISHTDSYILIGISDSEIGVDIEETISLERCNHLIKKFDKETILEYNESRDKEKYFTSKWVILEAYSKMIGTGISFSLMKELNLKEDVYYFYNENSKKAYYYAVINKESEKIGGVNYVL